MFEALIGIISSWSTTPGGSFAREKPGFRQRWLAFSTALAVVPRAWQLRMERLKNGRSFGRFFAASRDKLRESAKRLNVRHLVNLVGCAAPS